MATLIQGKKKALSRQCNLAAESSFPLTHKVRYWIFSFLPSYLTVPFLSFWRLTSPLV